MVDISGRTASVCGDLLCLWERFLVSNSAWTVRSQDERLGLTLLKPPVLRGWGINETSLDWNQPGVYQPTHPTLQCPLPNLLRGSLSPLL